MATRTFSCFAHGRDASWEAICIDLDIAVTGRSFSEVKRLLSTAIKSYVEDARAESPEEAKRLLSRSAPWYVHARLQAEVWWCKLRSRFDGRNGEKASGFDIPCLA